MPTPASNARQLLGREAQLAVADPTTDNPVERFLYAASVLHCLPVGRVEADSAETGTVMRPSTFTAYATDAGFSSVEVLPIEHDLFRFYRLHQ